METITNAQQFKTWAEKRNIVLLPELHGFKLGDNVTYTNEFGVSFPDCTIIGIQQDDSFYDRQFYINKESYWFPIKAKELKHSN